MGVNNLADIAADIYSDFVGAKSLLRDQQIAGIKLLRVCKRLAALESELRRGTVDPPRVAADIVAACQEEGETRRTHDTAVAASRVAKAMLAHAHNLTFHFAKEKLLCTA